jgi:hypothetical protein
MGVVDKNPYREQRGYRGQNESEQNILPLRQFYLSP